MTAERHLLNCRRSESTATGSSGWPTLPGVPAAVQTAARESRQRAATLAPRYALQAAPVRPEPSQWARSDSVNVSSRRKLHNHFVGRFFARQLAADSPAMHHQNSIGQIQDLFEL